MLDEPITIKQLAQMLGLAHSTVSRALNGHPAISEATKKRIAEAAAKAGYVPNSAAQSLKTARSHTIGLVVPDIQNAFYATVAKTIATAAADQSWQLVLAITEDQPGREAHAIESLLKAQAEGVIIVPTAAPEPETLAMIKRLRVVQLLRHHPRIESPAITLADRYGISAATEHLQALGHERIGYIGAPTAVTTGRERLQGFLDRFSASPESRDEAGARIQIGPPKKSFAADAFRRLLAMSEPPSAIVLGSQSFALGVLLAARQDNIRIPADVSLVGYGDSEWCTLLDGGLTALSLPVQEIAQACVDTLRKRLEMPPTRKSLARAAQPEHIFLPKLIIRGSSRRRG